MRTALMLAALLAYAALALGSGLDRAAPGHPQLARWVPALFAARAGEVRAAQALGSGNGREAEWQAGQALRADPVAARPAALLGAAQVAQRHFAAANRTFRIAARFGWREPATQLYFIDAAMAAGWPRLAMLRLDALLRQDPAFMLRDMLLARFEGSVAGRAALAERLALRPAWSAAFLDQTAGLTAQTLLARAAVAELSGGAGWGCDAVAGLVTRLAARQLLGAALGLWRSQCPAAAMAGVADPHFTALPQGREPVPFEWTLAGNGDLMSSPDPGGRGLRVAAGGAAMQPVAWQLLPLPQGRYRLSWVALGADGRPAPGAEVALACQPGLRQPLAAQLVDPAAGHFAAEVVLDARCAGRFLALWAGPASGAFRFDDPRIEPR